MPASSLLEQAGEGLDDVHVEISAQLADVKNCRRADISPPALYTVSMFGKRKGPTKAYDRETQIPVLRCSICTGEQVAGFKDLRTGAFEDVALIRSDADLKAFMRDYGIEKITKEY